MRRQFLIGVFVALAVNALGALYFPWILWSLVVVGPLIILGIQDYLQTRQTVRRNFPLAGRFRYIFEAIRPEIYQYFIESNSDGMPFSREKRSIIYQRSKRALDTLPFGAQRDVYATGYEWVNHSLLATRVLHESLRIRIGGPDCERPYSASPLNISAMSYGALSKNAILALGADVLYAARAMMLSLGCIQALRCNANICPTGIATQDANLIAGLHVLPSAGWFTCITKRR